MGGLFGSISVSIPQELNKSAELAVSYMCGLGLLMSIGGFAYGALWLFPRKREEGWIATGLSIIGNTRDFAAWNPIFTKHLYSIEAANHDLRKHLGQISKLVLSEVILLVIGFISAFVVFN